MASDPQAAYEFGQFTLVPTEKRLMPDGVVEEQALAHNVSQLRKVLGDPAEDPKFIETVPKRGYRFIAAVRALGEPAPVIASPATSGVVPSAIPLVPSDGPGGARGSAYAGWRYGHVRLLAAR